MTTQNNRNEVHEEGEKNKFIILSKQKMIRNAKHCLGICCKHLEVAEVVGILLVKNISS